LEKQLHLNGAKKIKADRRKEGNRTFAEKEEGTDPKVRIVWKVLTQTPE